MRLCACQLATSADADDTLARHVAAIRAAAAQGCEAVVFPELSLTGYTTRVRAEQVYTVGHATVATLQAEAEAGNIAVLCGAPLRASAGVEIGMFILEPGRPARTYAKQILHADEMPSFVPGTRVADVARGAHRLAPAICYESRQPAHAEAALARGVTVYVASVAKPAPAMQRASAWYAALAEARGVAVVVANAVGPCDDFVAAGGSAAWSAGGVSLGVLGARDPGALIVDV
ncbi:MAG: nitrilase-related carbon-nitrogen hydrolase [Myxococcota bacterium]